MSAKLTLVRLRRRIPRNRINNRHHDPSLDAAIIAEFENRYPTLEFLSFFRSLAADSRYGCLHVIEFVALPSELLEARVIEPMMIPPPEIGHWFDNVPSSVYTKYDRRRKGKLTVEFRLWESDSPSASNPFAWLSPKLWKKPSDKLRKQSSIRLVWSNPATS